MGFSTGLKRIIPHVNGWWGEDTYEFGGCKNFAAAEKSGRFLGD